MSLWSQLLGAWRAHADARAPTTPDHDALQALLGAHAHKLVSAEGAVSAIRPGSHVYVGSACGTPRALLQALEALSPAIPGVELVHFLTDGALPHDADGRPATRYRHRTFFVGQDLRAAVREGLAEYVPMSVARLPELIANGRVPVDVALVQVSMPDAFGYVSLGVSVDVAPAAVAKAKLVIAEINPAMPRAMGDSMLHLDQLHHLVPVDTPVIEYVHAPVQTHALQQIARYVGSIIDDGSTLQIGLGRIPNEALKYLHDRRDLGIHSDVVTDAIVPLLEQGILTGRAKSQQRGKIVASFAMGDRKLYDLIDRNPLFSLQPIDGVCAPTTIAAQHKMVSVTQAFAIDLTGQVIVDRQGGEFYGGIAAQGEFLRGASRSPGGKAIICLAATEDDGVTSRIHATLREGDSVTIARTDVHYVVTEYGVAYLFGKSIRERAVALIGLAHPDARPALFEQARALGYLPPGQTLQNLRAYPVEDESTVTLKDGRALLLRPALASDAEGVRALFHRLSETDVYTRFFRNLRSLSQGDVQRLCNVNLDTEVAFVAVTGPREDPTVVAHACYFVNAETGFADTAFMISSGWQGAGLGGALQRRLVEHAKARGVKGFVADVLRGNAGMVRLARAMPGEVSVEKDDDSVHITARF